MKKVWMKLNLFFFATVLACVNCLAQPSSMFVTGYYPVWSIGSTNGGNASAMYPETMNWQGLTHIVHFGSGPIVTAPYWNPQANNSFGGPSNDSLNLMYGVDWRGNTNYRFIDSLKKYAHLAGVKLLLSCGGIWGTQAANMNFITSDSSRTQQFVDAFIAFCSRNGYDGVEIDYEPPQSQTAMSLLTRVMRRKMTTVLGVNAPLVITVADLAEGNYSLALKDSVTQYLFMMYDMHNPYNGIGSPGGPYDVTGYNAPLHLPDANQYPILGTSTLNYDGQRPVAPTQFWGPNQFASMGFPRSKIGVGLPFYGYVFDTKSAPNQSAVGVYAHYLNYVDVLSFLNNGGSKHWDNTAKVPWAGGQATANIGWVITAGHQTYVTFDDTASVREKVRWAKNNGFGGMMIYELWTGWVASAPQGQKDPLLRALVSEVNNTAPPLPTGTFTASPDTLPVGGGSVTLSWTSSNAQTASIDNGIGNVSLTGSRGVTVGSSTTYTLTLTNQNGSQQCTARVFVALPSGQGQQDITAQGTPIALITNPTGAGNHDIEIIRDGNTPPVGSTNVLEQYDTFTGTSGRTFEWIGFQFASAHSFTKVTYHEGLDNQWGGCFETLHVQVRTSGQWNDVPDLVSVPPYPGTNLVNFETFELSFASVRGDAIRIAGPPTGSERYVGVGELRVFDDGTTSVLPSPNIPRDFELWQNYPNPFNPTTRIAFGLPVTAQVILKVYNLLGQEVASLMDGGMEAGCYSVEFSGERLSNGVYFYVLKADKFTEMKKMVLLK